MSDNRRRASVLALGAASLALIASPLAALAQDDEAMATVSEACQAANLGDMLKNPGRLTLSTDNPSFGPWWGGDPSVDLTAAGSQLPAARRGPGGWRGLRRREALGFSDDQVDWIQNTGLRAGLRSQARSHSTGTWRRSRSVPSAPRTSTSATPTSMPTSRWWPTPGRTSRTSTSIEELKGYDLGAAVGTTSLQFIEEQIQPDAEPQVFNDNAAAIQALENGQIDGLVVDLGRPSSWSPCSSPTAPSWVSSRPLHSRTRSAHGPEKDSPLTDVRQRGHSR